MVAALVTRKLGEAVNRKRVLRVMREQRLIQRRRRLDRPRRPGYFRVSRPDELSGEQPRRASSCDHIRADGHEERCRARRGAARLAGWHELRGVGFSERASESAAFASHASLGWCSQRIRAHPCPFRGAARLVTSGFWPRRPGFCLGHGRLRGWLLTGARVGRCGGRFSSVQRGAPDTDPTPSVRALRPKAVGRRRSGSAGARCEGLRSRRRPRGPTGFPAIGAPRRMSWPASA